ncbi:hypothetical protein WICPIJ_001138 [Wickerhamomyces pijperi]|uniref:Thioredoxin-like fold domain-containing protein n=1 Tax=Wickerhamomyces pijperi TaxID=599730 RepID=A0A9P8TR00_WICPI|nr:hypothetical protein WICPIJ_001138 [Wickerhamomyces pijperi]
MSLLPKFSRSHIYPPLSSIIKVPEQLPNTIEVYLDYACPYSGKLYKKWYNELFPYLTQNPDKYRFIFKNYVQVWHPTSTLLHEASLAFQYVEPQNFLKFSYLLFDHIEEFYDTAVANSTRNEIYDKIYEIVIKPNGFNITKEQFLDNLTIVETQQGQPHRNSGNATSNDLKWFTKTGRQQGIHVTPTVVINGYEDQSIESSTEVSEVIAKLEKL